MHARTKDPGPSLTRRIGVLALAVAQLVGALALPVADGILDIEPLGLPAHVESPGNDDCTPHHDHAFCQVVRAGALAMPAPVPTTLVLGHPVIQRTAARAASELLRSGRVFQGSSGPRAPPAA